MRLNIVILFSTVVYASGLMRLDSEDLNRLLTLASLPGKKLEKEVRRIFFEGWRKIFSKEISNKEFLRLRELFSLERVLNRVEKEGLPIDIVIIAMLVTDGKLQTKYVDYFEWNHKARYGIRLIRVLIEEMETNRIYTSMQRATVASMAEICHLHPNASSIIAGQCMGSQYWGIPGRWRRTFEIMLNIRAIWQRMACWKTYDKKLLKLIKKSEFADLFCNYMLEYREYYRVAERNAGFMELLITSETLTDELHVFILNKARVGEYESFLNLVVERSGESP